MCLETFQILDYCKAKKIELAFEFDVQKPPEVSNEMIRFNGVADEGHETFILFKKKPKGQDGGDGQSRYFYFCKTARKPYDLAVCLVLLSLANHATKSMKITSDGDWDGDWTDARTAYKELFGVDPESFQKSPRVRLVPNDVRKR